MGDGVQAADPSVVAEVPASVLNTAPLRIGTTDLALLYESDTCLRKLIKQEAELKAQPLPSAQQISKLWTKAVEAYWAWATATMTAPKRQEDLEEIRLAIRRRKIVLQETATKREIHRIRARLGPRFQNLPEPKSNVGSRELTAHALSALQKETSESPPPPSA